jgi:hypothetical protein
MSGSDIIGAQPTSSVKLHARISTQEVRSVAMQLTFISTGGAHNALTWSY